jgi:hypothetical protein
MASHRFGVVGVGLLCLALAPPLRAAAPDAAAELSKEMKAALELTAKIDRLVEAHWTAKGVQPAPPADDAEFLRRVYLDIAGRIPRIGEVRRFLEDQAPDKRLRLIEHLLAKDHDGRDSPSYRYVIKQLAEVWRAQLLPETNNQRFNQFGTALDAWLKDRLGNNVGYDQLVRELLTARVAANAPQGGRPVALNPNEPSPLAFYQANEFKPENLAAATSRLFLGVKLECAQCHDHPFAKWKREQFWEYAAFFAGIQPQRGGFAAQRDEAAAREITIPGTERKVQARFLDGAEPKWQDGTTTRATLAEWVTAPDNPYFAKAAVNRLWAHFFGIGLIDPVDEMVGAENSAGNEELLNLLAREFVEHQFDLQFLMRAITASKAYQLTSAQTDPSQADPRLLARMNLKGLTPEQLFDSLAAATGYREPANPNQRVVVFPGVNTPRGEFLAKFANHSDKRTEYSTSILQALMLMNGRFVENATAGDEAALNDPQMQKSVTLGAIIDFPFFDTTEKKIEALYLATLSRPPRANERERLVKYVEKDNPSGDPKKALADVLWTLLNSSEFILNH